MITIVVISSTLVSKCRGHIVLRRMTELIAIGDFTPVLNAFLSLLNERIGRVYINPEKRRDLLSEIEIKGIVVSRDIESKAGVIRIGIDAVGRSEDPALRRQQETVVAEIIIGIVDCNVEYDPFPEFPQIGIRRSAVLHDEFGNVEVPGSILIICSIRFAEQRHNRSEMNTVANIAIETPGKKLNHWGRTCQVGIPASTGRTALPVAEQPFPMRQSHLS